MPVFKSWQLDLVPSENWEHLQDSPSSKDFPLKLSWWCNQFLFEHSNTEASPVLFVSPQNSFATALTPMWLYLGDKAGKESLRLNDAKGGLIGKGFMSSQKETPEHSLILSPSPSMYWGKTRRGQSIMRRQPPANRKRDLTRNWISRTLLGSASSPAWRK